MAGYISAAGTTCIRYLILCIIHPRRRRKKPPGAKLYTAIVFPFGGTRAIVYDIYGCRLPCPSVHILQHQRNPSGALSWTDCSKQPCLSSHGLFRYMYWRIVSLSPSTPGLKIVVGGIPVAICGWYRPRSDCTNAPLFSTAISQVQKRRKWVHYVGIFSRRVCLVRIRSALLSHTKPSSHLKIPIAVGLGLG